MRVKELEDLIIDMIGKADHPEIVSVESAVGEDDPPTKHARVRVKFASGAKAHVQVYKVTGPGIPHSGNYEVPKEAL